MKDSATAEISLERLPKEQREAWQTVLLILADDELAAGHRASEWLGLAPSVEEDIAFASIAQDELGHARFYYQWLARLENTDVDAFVFRRPSADWRNAVFLERVRGDFAEAMLRVWLYDEWDAIRLKALASCSFAPLAVGAKKMLREEEYHLEHARAWMKRLASGGEARVRLTTALAHSFPALADLADFGSANFVLPELLGVDIHSLRDEWKKEVAERLEALRLVCPAWPEPQSGGRMGRHTEDMQELLSTMTEVSRWLPEVSW
ncbi:phenylacetate-CoA oxygenase subunit PaaC [Alicyclobacillus sp. TC]|uniref:1,2-phenylacetyl-CoA epoxidase subunit PaaC n=1 Tax=Alicyclobacillus sp. TC TaxID=2606450 RepID=UPI001931456B|nr:1,2-phenylacetyl-CoA epoxidase subunit PaaC [Alicyclobacillus sp. TC]QRF24084.1 phenylacetate-CoA oxygenase subunit PaaC [Alicyclobacillus sp. TC]